MDRQQQQLQQQQANANNNSSNQVTEEHLLFLTECKSLNDISVISLRNKGLTQCFRVLSQCGNLTIAYLQFNRISLQDMQLHMGRLQFLQKIDLSCNQIKKLPEGRVFEEMRSLKVLYLHDNMINQWEDLQSLKYSQSLVHLTLQRNPVSQIAGYRSQLVNQIPHLKALDDYIITDEERIEITSPIAMRFRALSPHYMKIVIPKFQENQQADQHLFNLEVDLYRIRRLFERNSPSIRIQSYFRGYRVRTQAYFSANDRVKAAIKIQKVYRGWIYRLKVKRELEALLKEQGLEELLLTQPQYRRFKATALIGSAVSKFAKKVRREKLELRSALKIQTCWRKLKAKHQAYFEKLNLDKDPRFYFLKEQRLDFQKILRSTLENYKVLKKVYTLDKLKSMATISSDYQMIRYPNPLIFKRQTIPIVQFTTPTTHSKLNINKGTSALIRGGRSITNQYLRFTGMDQEKEVLSKLNKRFCHTSNEDVSLIPNQRKKNHTKKRIHTNQTPKVRQNKVFDNYQEVMMFTTDDSYLMKCICDSIWKHNLNEDHEVFMVFLPKLMDRIAAAVKIQQSWRAYRIRKRQKASWHRNQLVYPVNEYFIANAIIQKRAVNCISQWWKSFKLTRRLEALTSIKKYISKIDHPTLFIEESIYTYFSMIFAQKKWTLRFIEQNLKFDFKHPLDSEPNYQITKPLPISGAHNANGETINSDGDVSNDNAAVMHQTSGDAANKIQIVSKQQQNTNSWHIVFANSTNHTHRFKYHPVPRWITDEIEEFDKYKLSDDQISIFFGKEYGIIHKASFEQLPEVRDFNEIVDPSQKTMNMNLGLKFISIHCMSVSEAQKRALLVALLSYNLKERSFIRMFTQKTLGDGMCIKSLYDIWKQYRINDPELRMHALLNNNATLTQEQKEQQVISIKEVREKREKQKKQPHSGFCLTEGGRWEYEELSKLRFDKIETNKSLQLQIVNTSTKAGVQNKSKRDAHTQNEALPYVYLHQTHVIHPIDIGNKRNNVEIRMKDATGGQLIMDESNVHNSYWMTQKYGDPMLSSSQPSNIVQSHLQLIKQGHSHPTTAPSGGAFGKHRINAQALQNSNRNLQPGFYYHTSSKEPIASVKNIGNDSPIRDQLKMPRRFQGDKAEVIGSGERTTKAGTALPSMRQSGTENTSINKPPATASTNNYLYKSMNKTNFQSAIQSQTSSPVRYGTAGLPGPRKGISTIQSSGGITAFSSQVNINPLSTQKHGGNHNYASQDSGVTQYAGEQQNLWLLKKQREEMAEMREMQRELMQKEVEAKKDEIAKARQVSEVMKHVIKVEQEANMRMYQRFNREEKELIKDLRSQDLEKLNAHHQTNKSVVHTHFEVKRKRSEERDFALNFSQIRNMIAKQTKAGEIIRFKSNAIKRNKANAQLIKNQEEDFIEKKKQLSSMAPHNKSQTNVILGNKQAVPIVEFDTCEIQEMTFNQRLGIQTAGASPTGAAQRQGTGQSLGQRARKIIHLRRDTNQTFNSSNNYTLQEGGVGGLLHKHGDSFLTAKTQNQPGANLNNSMIDASNYDTQRVLDYAPNHVKDHFAEISARVPNKKSIVPYQPPIQGGIGAPLPAFAAQTNVGVVGQHNRVMSSHHPMLPSTFQAPPPGSRHMQRLTFIEEKFPINAQQSNANIPPGSANSGIRQISASHGRYEQAM